MNKKSVSSIFILSIPWGFLSCFPGPPGRASGRGNQLTARHPSRHLSWINNWSHCTSSRWSARHDRHDTQTALQWKCRSRGETTQNGRWASRQTQRSASFFLVENHGILRLFLPIHYETSTDSVVLYPYWCGIDCHGRSLIPHCHCISSLQVEVLARRMLACCGSGSFTGGTWPKPHPSDTVSINRSNNVNVFRWRFWVCFYRQPMWLLNPTLSFFSKKHLLTRMSSLKTSPVDPFR